MDGFLKMDVFFFVTTVVVVLLGVISAYVLWRITRILRHVERISAQVAEEAEIVREDIGLLRTRIRGGAGRIKSLIHFFGASKQRRSKKP